MKNQHRAAKWFLTLLKLRNTPLEHIGWLGIETPNSITISQIIRTQTNLVCIGFIIKKLTNKLKNYNLMFCSLTAPSMRGSFNQPYLPTSSKSNIERNVHCVGINRNEQKKYRNWQKHCKHFVWVPFLDHQNMHLTISALKSTGFFRNFSLLSDHPSINGWHTKLLPYTNFY